MPGLFKVDEGRIPDNPFFFATWCTIIGNQLNLLRIDPKEQTHVLGGRRNCRTTAHKLNRMIPHGCTEPTEPPKYESHMRPKCARIHMKFVEYIAHKVTVLHQGQILSEGTMEHVKNDPKVIEVYLGH